MMNSHLRNCIILGSGRSGTSMAAGILGAAGYFMGDHVYPPNPTNPKGMFEDRDINALNEDILSIALPEGGEHPDVDHPRRWQRWLARIPLDADLSATGVIEEGISRLVIREPFCFKDPRFSYSLPVWRPFLKDAVYVCVFRDPASTVESMLRQARKVRHLEGFQISAADAFAVWTMMYRHILERHSRSGAWLFLDYESLLCSDGLQRLRGFTGACVDATFPERHLRHAYGHEITGIPEEALDIHRRLCERAGRESRPGLSPPTSDD